MLAEAQTQELSCCGRGDALTPQSRMDSVCDLCGAWTAQLELGTANHIAVQDDCEDQPPRNCCYRCLDVCLRLLEGLGPHA